MKSFTFVIVLALAVIGGAVSLSATSTTLEHASNSGNGGGWWPLTSELPIRH